jgi:hypothetical protein
MKTEKLLKWVSVSERMPTKTDYYTCAAGADFKFCGQSYFSLIDGRFSNMAISHWMEETEGIVLSPEVLDDFEKQIVSIMESMDSSYQDDCGNGVAAIESSEYRLLASVIIGYLSQLKDTTDDRNI